MRPKTVYYAMGNHSVRKIHFKCTPLTKINKKNICKSVFSLLQTREKIAAAPNSLLQCLVGRCSGSSTLFILCINLSFRNETAYKKKTFLLTLIASRERIPRMNRRRYTGTYNMNAHHHRRQHLTIDSRSGFESEFASRNLFSIHNIFSQQKFRQALAFLHDMYFVFNFEMVPVRAELMYNPV